MTTFEENEDFWNDGPTIAEIDAAHKRAEQNSKYAAEHSRAEQFKRGKVLPEAYQTINGKRQDAYGNPEDSFEVIGMIWQIIDQFQPDELPNSARVALKMMGLKMARLIKNPYDRDNARDLCGYTGLFVDQIEAKDVEKD